MLRHLYVNVFLLFRERKVHKPPYVMLYGYLYSASRRRLFRGALSVTDRGKEQSSNYVETQVMSPVASHSGVQEEYHSKVQDPQPQRPGSGIEEYGPRYKKITAIGDMIT